MLEKRSKTIILSLFSAFLCFFVFTDADAADSAIKKPVKPITIISKKMEANRDSRLVIFSGDVVAEGDFNLCADKLLVHYSEGDRIERIEALGNVIIAEQGRRAKGNNAVYDSAAKTLVITGDAVAKQCDDEVRGESITMYLESNNIEVTAKDGGRVRAVILPERKKCQEDSYGKEFQCRIPR